MKKRVAILGGGPSGLFVYKRLLETGRTDFSVDIFEAKNHLGSGMPYSAEGANHEHVTNVSGNEIPTLVTSVADWITTLPPETLQEFHIDPDHFNDYKVLPRLLFGKYLSAQFELLQQKARAADITTHVHFNSRVTDIIDEPQQNKLVIRIEGKAPFEFDYVIICTGHNWPRRHEGRVPGYFDSPYPPAKLAAPFNHRIAIRGSSLTAIDALRTLARSHGDFFKDDSGKLLFQARPGAEQFKVVMHSRHGLLPCVRFHLDDPHLSKESLLTPEEFARHRAENDGFVSLDFIFEKDFKESFREKEPSFYALIKDMTLEQFVDAMMDRRERVDPFQFFKGEYAEAKQSIRRQESIYWKEMLAVLSFALNYPAKHLSAEDMHRLQHVLMPLISIVIAFVPQSSCEELIALHDAGKLELISVGPESRIEPHPDGGITYHHTDDNGQPLQTKYQTYIDCVGQPHLSLDAFPFKTLVDQGAVIPAHLKFRSTERAVTLQKEGLENIQPGTNGDFYLKVPGLAITDNFEAINRDGTGNPHLYVMAVPYIGGYNPDYSGLDFCEEASQRIVTRMLNQFASEANAQP